MEYKATIGIEIHCELKTKSGMFSGAPNEFGMEANAGTCAIDLAMPGTLPELNEEGVRKAIQACTAFHLTLDPLVRFDRKNYFYSDLAKGYQITQQFHPLGRNGYLMIDTPEGKKKVRINRIHMEEDTAKQFHMNDKTLMDFNRSGVPLIEIVSEPDMSTGQEAEAYVEALRQTLYYIGASDAKMEEGSMRCDVNISLAPAGADHLGTKNEIKNINSISNVGKAIDFEIARQKAIYEAGGTIVQETRRFDDKINETVLMRKKEGVVDYKYFPEPNIPPIRLSAEWIKEIQDNMPELPDEKRVRYAEEYGLSSHDIGILIANKEMAEFYEKTMTLSKNAKGVCNWLLSDISGWLNKNGQAIENSALTPEHLAAFVGLIDDGRISSKQAKELLDDLMAGKDPVQAAKDRGLEQVSDAGAIEAIIAQVLDANPQAIADYAAGKNKAVGFLVGQVMKASAGKANPGMVNGLIQEMLKKRIG